MLLSRSLRRPYSYYYPSLLSDWAWPYKSTSARDDSWESTEDGYNLRIEIPGYGKEDVKMKVKEGILSIEVAESRSYSYSISEKYDVQSITASAKNGILNVHIPLKEEQKPAEIEISVD